MLTWHYIRNVPALKGGPIISSDGEDEESDLNMIRAAQKMRTTFDESRIHPDLRTQAPAPQAPTPQVPIPQVPIAQDISNKQLSSATMPFDGDLMPQSSPALKRAKQSTDKTAKKSGKQNQKIEKPTQGIRKSTRKAH